MVGAKPPKAELTTGPRLTGADQSENPGSAVIRVDTITITVKPTAAKKSSFLSPFSTSLSFLTNLGHTPSGNQRASWTIAIEIEEVGSGASVQELRHKLLDAARRRRIDVVVNDLDDDQEGISWPQNPVLGAEELFRFSRIRQMLQE